MQRPFCGNFVLLHGQKLVARVPDCVNHRGIVLRAMGGQINP